MSDGVHTDVTFVVNGAVVPFAPELGADIGIDITGGPPGITVGVDHIVVHTGLQIDFTAGELTVRPVITPQAPEGGHAAIDLAGITGGGYIRHNKATREWLGAIAADLGPVDVTGLFIIGHVGGDPSILTVLGIHFTPGIQLSFGFELTGVGGLIGINRRADTDLMRHRLAGGAVGNVLFSDDPVANAPAILDDLSRFFPAAAGTLIVGPTLQLSWLSPIVRADAAVLIELPGPSKIVILGTLRVLIGADENLALLFLRMDFLGVVDLQRQLISVDAALVNSHAMGIFRLTGGMALRIFYGTNPYVLLSIGGFHPRFDPGPLDLPAIPRVGAALEAPVGVFLRLEMYTAFTPNTLQAGALVQAGMRLGPLSVDGFFQFDALITFKPFTFDVDFAAGLAIRVFGETFGSITVSGRVTGPGPLVVRAQASVKVLFVRVRGSATFELGSRNGDSVRAIPSLLTAVAEELAQRENLRAEGTDPSIRLRRDVSRPENIALVSPTGTLVWTQKRIPLDTDVDRFEGAPLAGSGHRLHVTASGVGGTVEEPEWFSPGSFTALDLKSSQTLNNPGFERLPGGMRIVGGGAVTSGDAVAASLTLHLRKKPGATSPPFLVAGVVGYRVRGLLEAVRERDTTPTVAARPAAVGVTDETFRTADATGVSAPTTAFQAFQQSRASAAAFPVADADISVPL
ncbi:DUF6603 domain-containing protein [Gordonia sp. VNK1]|uniref:DUF6603 domain-containing protein n=1 Tax=Gordonia oleivorans TaxID=3156618 RepID=UPI0032B5DBAC